jgi:hypothetical protein
VIEQADYDSPWKDVLDLLFDSFMKQFFPFAHEQIDWARGFEFLDKELQKITADAAVGRRFVDKLVKVWLKTNQELWVLIHIEVQGTRETGFESRLYVYNFRILDRFNVPVATFVILTDEDDNWRPTEYRNELLGTEVRFRYSAAKLLDYRERWEELEQSDNPFAVVIQAHLTALETRRDERDRLERKLTLTQRMDERGFSEQVIIGLFRFLDWVLWLPDDLGAEFDAKMSEYEEERKMEYVTSTERRGIKKGRQEGSAGILLRQLQRRFGPLDEATEAHIRALSLEQLEELSDALLDFASLSDLEAWLQQHPQPSPLSGARGGNGARQKPDEDEGVKE